MELDFKNCTGNRKILYRISGNNTEKEYSTQQCPGRIKLDIGHREHKQGAIKGLNAMICYKVNNLLATDDARWKGEAWRTVKCGDQAATRFEFLLGGGRVAR
ncbi:hypothetical protein TIFTF001_033992 [Ficus carica]|uniref:Uncharacterized protein n=1 Tax=Ficus carica TaxID=3494 RepID=A0AA88DZ26_FICCA|nr:hypothetical protein TIFTF001_033992 [Ficus carica]